MTQTDIKYVAESRKSWGTSDVDELDAVYRMAGHWSGAVHDEEPVAIWACRGYRGGKRWNVDADEVLSHETFMVDGEEFERFVDASKSMDLQAEALLYEHARETTPDIAPPS